MKSCAVKRQNFVRAMKINWKINEMTFKIQMTLRWLLSSLPSVVSAFIKSYMSSLSSEKVQHCHACELLTFSQEKRKHFQVKGCRDGWCSHSKGGIFPAAA